MKLHLRPRKKWPDKTRVLLKEVQEEDFEDTKGAIRIGKWPKETGQEDKQRSIKHLKQKIE
jgi:uncharacterized protein YeaC (DUF1315 family)